MDLCLLNLDSARRDMTNNNTTFYQKTLNFRLVKMILLPLSILFSSFALATPPKSVLDLSGTEGKVVYVDFWASWCAPCQASFSYMNDLQSQFPESDFQIVLINLDQSREKADRFLRRVEEPVPSIYDPNGVIAKYYKVSAMPTSILIGRHGKIRYVHDGFHPEKTNEYTSHIKELLNEK
jgi:thiol-disulfide isomerase/thioredoxin